MKLHRANQYSVTGFLAVSAAACGSAVATELEELADYFVQAKVVSETSIVDDILSGGSKTACFRVTNKPEPKTHTPVFRCRA